MLITNNFEVSEFTRSDTAIRRGINNTVPINLMGNLKYLAERMEEVRELLGNVPIHISSGYRCEELNRLIGGSPTSAHCKALACDFTAPKYGTPYDICIKLAEFLPEFDQLIFEGSWVHLGFRNGEPQRKQLMSVVFKADGAHYFTGIQLP